jgi:hypothetical protein
MLKVTIQSVFIESGVIQLSDIALSFVMLSVIMPNVVAQRDFMQERKLKTFLGCSGLRDKTFLLWLRKT